MQYKIPIPYHCVWMVRDIQDRQKKKKLFLEYLEGHIKRTEPHLRFIKPQGMVAICERRWFYGRDKMDQAVGRYV